MIRASGAALAAAVGLGAAALALPLADPSVSLSGGPVVALLLSGMFLMSVVAAALRFAEDGATVREVSLVAMLGAFAAASRVPFAAIPSVQPVTFLVVAAGATFGAPAGFLVGAVAAVASNVALGQGPWTLYQAFAWGLAGASGALVARWRPGPRAWAAFGAGWGFAFGWLLDVWVWLAFYAPLTLSSLALVLALSFPFDLLHAVGNAVLFLAFGPRALAILARHRAKLVRRPLETEEKPALIRRPPAAGTPVAEAINSPTAQPQN